jgi:uncharacterized protein with HEPN domain
VILWTRRPFETAGQFRLRQLPSLNVGKLNGCRRMIFEDERAAPAGDMLDAALSVREFTSGVTQGEYLKDRKLQLAVERALEIIGEAARLVSPTFKANHTEVPWKEIIGQRNVLALRAFAAAIAL